MTAATLAKVDGTFAGRTTTLSGLMEGLAAAWLGWVGIREWQSLEHELTIAAFRTRDRTPRVDERRTLPGPAGRRASGAAAAPDPQVRRPGRGCANGCRDRRSIGRHESAGAMLRQCVLGRRRLTSRHGS